MKVGRYTVRQLSDGFFRLDGGAMFGIVPKPLWAKKSPPDERNRIRMALRTLLIEGEGRKILLDCGIGSKMNAKDRDIFGRDEGDGDLIKSLEKLGISPSEVTDIIPSHLHFDHCGWLTKLDEKGKLIPTFPDARIHVQKKHWQWALNPPERERGSFLDWNIEMFSGSENLRLMDGPGEVLPGIEVMVTDGHTRGHQLVKIDGGNKETTILFIGDLVPTSAHFKLRWTMAYDIEPLLIEREKESLLSRAEREGWIIAFGHDPDIGACRIKRSDGEANKVVRGSGYDISEVVSI